MSHSAIVGPFISRRSLPRYRTMVLRDAKDVTVKVDRGTVWMTLEHDTRDIVLDEGRQFRIPNRGRTVITAEAPTRLTFVRPPSALVRVLARVAPRLASWARALGGAMERRWRGPIPYL